MEQEIWKDIEGYEWLYKISSSWKVKSLKSWPYHNLWVKILKPWKDTHGYKFQILSNINKQKRHLRINRLVAQAFLWLDINNTKIYVCHKDDNPLNNNLNNLFLWTHQDNMNDKKNKWRSADVKWQYNPNSKLTNNDVLYIRWIINPNAKLLAKEFWVRYLAIRRILSRKSWIHI